MIQAIWLFKGTVYDFEDSGLLNYPTIGLWQNGFFVWSANDYSGMISPISSLWSQIFYLIEYFLASLNHTVGVELYYGLELAFGGICLFLLIFELTEGHSYKIRAVAAALPISMVAFFELEETYHHINCTRLYLLDTT